MRTKHAIWLFLALAVASTGCWDAGDAEECVGVSCPGGLQWPHGGELRSWYIRLPDGSEVRRLYGVFIADEEKVEGVSESSLYTRPMPAIGRCAPDVTAIQGTNRQYIDVGESITFQLGDREITVPRATSEGDMPVVDFYKREHDVAYLLETNEPTTESFFNAEHTVTTADSVAFEDKLTGLYMPPALEVLSPTGIPAQIPRGQDLVIEWQQVEPEKPGIVVGAAIVFAPTTTPPTTPTLCIAANTGRFVVPAEVIDGLASDNGIMLVGTAANQAVLNDGRIINMWGQNCKAIPWVRTN